MHRSKGLFDDLVGQREQLIRDFQVKRLGGLHVKYPRPQAQLHVILLTSSPKQFRLRQLEAFQVSGVFTISDIDRRGFDVR
ncbi:hypothetical protein SAMN05443247_01916 [Bradyrhizobium erythrophlei]|nr:hypothetical protein SAMN05443247_01916 [Bradyrhizobium erythrophlei]